MNEAHRTIGPKKVRFPLLMFWRWTLYQNAQVCQNYRRKLNHAFDLLAQTLTVYSVSYQSKHIATLLSNWNSKTRTITTVNGDWQDQTYWRWRWRWLKLICRVKGVLHVQTNLPQRFIDVQWLVHKNAKRSFPIEFTGLNFQHWTSLHCAGDHSRLCYMCGAIQLLQVGAQLSITNIMLSLYQLW